MQHGTAAGHGVTTGLEYRERLSDLSNRLRGTLSVYDHYVRRIAHPNSIINKVH